MSSELSAKPPPFDIAAMSSDQNISSCYEAAETAIKQAEILRQRQPSPTSMKCGMRDITPCVMRNCPPETNVTKNAASAFAKA
ncbi:MAG: hypothetical protein LIO63_05235 [Akkermansia sp.]|nr:hypothetical protein [Akkermansia sp.]